jgi:hypothetical protein
MNRFVGFSDLPELLIDLIDKLINYYLSKLIDSPIKIRNFKIILAPQSFISKLISTAETIRYNPKGTR